MIWASVAQVICKRGVPMAVVSLASSVMMTWIGLAGIAAA